MERLELSVEMKQILAEGARLAHAEGAREFGVGHVRRALRGECAETDSTSDHQGLVQFSEGLRDVLAAAQVRARVRGGRQVDAGDFTAALS